MQSIRHENLTSIIHHHSSQPFIPHSGAIMPMVLNEHQILYFSNRDLMLLNTNDRKVKWLNHQDVFSFHQVAPDQLITVSQTQINLWNLNDFSLIHAHREPDIKMGFQFANDYHHYNIKLKQHHLAVTFCRKRNCLIGYGGIKDTSETRAVLWIFDIAKLTMHYHTLPDKQTYQNACVVTILQGNTVAIIESERDQIIFCEIFRAHQTWYASTVDTITLPRDALFANISRYHQVERLYLSADQQYLGVLYTSNQRLQTLKFWHWQAGQFELMFERTARDLKACHTILPTSDIVFMDDAHISAYNLKERRETIFCARHANDLDLNLGLDDQLSVLQHDPHTHSYYLQLFSISFLAKANTTDATQLLSMHFPTIMAKDLFNLVVNYGQLRFFHKPLPAERLRHKAVAVIEAQIDFYENLAAPLARPPAHAKALSALHELKQWLIPFCMTEPSKQQSLELNKLIAASCTALQVADHRKNTQLERHIKILTLLKRSLTVPRNLKQSII